MRRLWTAVLDRLAPARRPHSDPAERSRAAIRGLRAHQAALRRFRYPDQDYWSRPPDGD